MEFIKKIQNHPILYGIYAFLFMFIPNIVAGWWSLLSDKPMIPTIARWMGNMDVPDISIKWFSWITVPLGLAMLGYIIYFARKTMPKKRDHTIDTLTEERKQKVKEALPKLTLGECAGLKEILIQGGLLDGQIRDYLKSKGLDNPEHFYTSVNSKIPILKRDFEGINTIKPDFKGIIHSLIDDNLFRENKERQRPKLEVTFKQGVRPWFQPQPKRHSPYRPNLTYLGDLYTYRIEIINIGLKSIKNIQTKLLGIEPHPPEFFPPFPLQIMHDMPNNLQMTKDARGGLFVDVFGYFCAPENNYYELGVCHTVSGVERKIPIQPYKIKIEVSSDNGGEPITKWFQFDPKKEDVKSMMEMID